MNCDFSTMAPWISCGIELKKLKGIFNLNDCKNDTTNHFTSIKLHDQTKIDEKTLILLRAFKSTQSFSCMVYFNICAKHRQSLGLSWRQRKVCSRF